MRIFKEFINEWVSKNKGRRKETLIKIIQENQEYYDELKNYTKYLETDDIQKMVYHYHKELTDIPMCAVCKKGLIYRNFRDGYSKFCSQSCQVKFLHISGILNVDTYKRTTNTYNERYPKGSSQQKEIIRKTQETSLKNCGYKHHMKSPKLREKFYDIIQEKTGFRNPAQSPQSKLKLHNMWANMGIEEKQLFIKFRHNKYIASMLEKHNVENPFLVEEFQIKAQETNIKKRGVRFNFQSPDVRQRSANTIFLLYGVKNIMHDPYFQHKNMVACYNFKDYVFPSGVNIKIQGDGNKALDFLLDVLGYSENDIKVEFECKYINYIDNKGIERKYRPDIWIEKDNKIIEVKSFWTFNNGIESNILKYKAVIDQNKNFEFWIFNHQKELFRFDFKHNPIIDILEDIAVGGTYLYGSNLVYIPEKKIMFHIQRLNESYNKKTLNSLKYHLGLTNNGSINFINIFEDLLINKKDIIVSRIKNIFNQSNKIAARKTSIRVVDSKIATHFLKENHIQGSINSKISIGLYNSDELVSLMTFGNRRKSLGANSLENHWEMLRFCNKKNFIVIGGASKLLKYFIIHFYPEEIISYCDYNWSTGNLYEKLNFIKKDNIIPNYYWCIDGKRYHRFAFRKDFLIKKGFDAEKTEAQIMEEQGYTKIYDCGTMKYSKIYTNNLPSKEPLNETITYS